jgi:hypothetical protein
MIALLLLAVASPAPAPVLYSAQARSIAYRDCIAAARERRPAAAAGEIGRAACARERARLVAGVREHVSYGWAAAARTDAQARRLKAQLKLEAESRVTAFENELQAWLERSG